LTNDLVNLYDIELVTEEEFNWFLLHSKFKPDTYAVNKYNAEQSIVINYLRKNGAMVPCEYSTHVNDYIEEQSNRYLVNNFYPVPFGEYGIQPQKSDLLAINCVNKYTDYYTQYEWQCLYQRYCAPEYKLADNDKERLLINRHIKIYVVSKIIERFEKIIFGRPFVCSSLIATIRNRIFPKIL
jgi:hypothetical protein